MSIYCVLIKLLLIISKVFTTNLRKCYIFSLCI